MYKNVLLIMMAAAFLWACGGQTTANQEETTQQEEVVAAKPTSLKIAEFKEKAETLVGQEVIIEGDVIHVCKHGGKKMFLTDDDPDIRIKITSGEEMTAFEPELEGSHIKVFGIVEAIEAEVTGEGQLHEEDADHTNHYHKPQYSIACIKYVVEETTPDGE